MSDRFGYSRKEKREIRENLQKAVEKDIRRKTDGKKAKDPYNPKTFNDGILWFNEGMALVDAPENLRNNTNFIDGYEKGRRLAMIEEMKNNEPQFIVNNAYQIVIKEELVAMFYPESEQYDIDEIKALNKTKNPLIRSFTKLCAPRPIAKPPALANATGILAKISYSIDPIPIIYTVYFKTLFKTSPIVNAFCGSKEKLFLLATCLSTNFFISLFPIFIEKYIKIDINITDIIFSTTASRFILLVKKSITLLLILATSTNPYILIIHLFVYLISIYLESSFLYIFLNSITLLSIISFNFSSCSTLIQIPQLWVIKVGVGIILKS